jgi:hypothetical protein
MGERPGRVDAPAALAAAADVGPYFVVERWAADAQWRPLSVLMSDPLVLSGRVDHARRVIADNAGISPTEVEGRVAASIVFLGLASRLVAPVLGAAVLGGVVPLLAVDELWWRPVDGGPWPIAAGPADGVVVGDLAVGKQTADAAVLISERCVRGTAEPMLAAFEAHFRLSPQVLWGNVASALAGAAGMLAEAFPSRAEAAGRLTGAILGQGPLRGTGELVQPETGLPRWFLVRNSCCLFYRVPGAGMCGDCVLAPEDVRRQQWQAVLARSAVRR